MSRSHIDDRYDYRVRGYLLVWSLQCENGRSLWVFSLLSYFVERRLKVEYNFAITTNYRLDLNISTTMW